MRILLTTSYQSDPKQAMRVTLNQVNFLKGEKNVIQANKWRTPQLPVRH